MLKPLGFLVALGVVHSCVPELSQKRAVAIALVQVDLLLKVMTRVQLMWALVEFLKSPLSYQVMLTLRRNRSEDSASK